jgi:ArsR family transcriptional regulator, virulence genes transcriptional regulator
MDVAVLDLAEKQAEIFRVFGNARRLYILWLLSDDGELSVNQIADYVGTTLQNISQHLGVLKRYGFVANRRDGQTIYYRIDKLDCFEQCPAILRSKKNSIN